MKWKSWKHLVQFSSSHFKEDATQNYLEFQPIYRHFKRVIGVGTGNYICFWKSKGLSDENITTPTKSDYKLNPRLSYFGTKTKLKLRESCLKQDKIIFNHGKIVNIYIVYELDKIYIKTSPTLVNCLFGAVSLTKNANINKYKYSRYRMGFDRGSVYSVGNRFDRNVIIFGVDMSLSVHVDNKGKNTLIIWKEPTQGLVEHSLTAEKMYAVTFTDHREKYCLSLHYNVVNSYLLVNGT